MTPIVNNGEFLEKLSLQSGGHESLEHGACVMEAASYVAGEPWSDHPVCVSKVITRFLVNWNDNLPTDEDRDRLLKPLIPLIIDTASPGLEERRAFMAMDWFIREHVPAWFDLTPALKPSGDALRALDEIKHVKALVAATVLLREAQKNAAAARAAAWAAAKTAAWEAAWEAAASAATSAAWEAAWAAARAAAKEAVWEAAASAATSAAWDAAASAATSAAWNAAREAAWEAAWEAARNPLKLTTERLQASAQDLVRRMAAGKQERMRTGAR